MAQNRTKSGISVLDDVPWGTHLCQFYQTKEDLIELLVPYFKAGLENNEFCTWVTSEPLRSEEAKAALKQAVNGLDSYLEKGQIEFLDYSEWYTKSGKFDANEVLRGWAEKEKIAAVDLATAVETRADGEKRSSIKVAEGDAKAIELRAMAQARSIQLIN